MLSQLVVLVEINETILWRSLENQTRDFRKVCRFVFTDIPLATVGKPVFSREEVLD